ncbi:MAG: Fic family protein [Acidimicrobiia bacterium]
MKLPSLQLVIEINRRVRSSDEWFDEPDDLDRVEKALQSIAGLNDPLEAAAVLAFRIAKAQGFAEGNKRTALLLARWILDNNGLDGRQIIDPDDRELADMLVEAASGSDVEGDIIRFFANRA